MKRFLPLGTELGTAISRPGLQLPRLFMVSRLPAHCSTRKLKTKVTEAARKVTYCIAHKTVDKHGRP